MPPGVTRTTAKALGKVTGRVPDHSKPIPNYNEADSSADLVAESSKSTSWRHQRSDLAHFSKEELSRARCGDKNISRKQKAESKRQPDQNDSLDPLDILSSQRRDVPHSDRPSTTHQEDNSPFEETSFASTRTTRSATRRRQQAAALSSRSQPANENSPFDLYDDQCSTDDTDEWLPDTNSAAMDAYRTKGSALPSSSSKSVGVWDSINPSKKHHRHVSNKLHESDSWNRSSPKPATTKRSLQTSSMSDVTSRPAFSQISDRSAPSIPKIAAEQSDDLPTPIDIDLPSAEQKCVSQRSDIFLQAAPKRSAASISLVRAIVPSSSSCAIIDLSSSPQRDFMTSTPPARKRPLIRGSSNVEHRPSKASKTKPTPRAKLMQPKQTPEQRQVKAAAASALSRSINEKGKGRARDEDEDQDDDVIYAKDAQGNDTSNVFSPVPGGEHSTTDDIFEGFTQIVGKRDKSAQLCPFCDERLPPEPSKRLLLMIEEKARNAKARKTLLNPNGVYLPFAECNRICMRHREEADVIPKGREEGWPSEGDIDWKKLEQRIQRLCRKKLSSVIKGDVHSDFWELAKKEWSEKGRMRMQNLANQFSTFDIELPGYYGPLGYEIILQQLRDHFAADPRLSVEQLYPLDKDSFIRRVLLPESALRLIQKDRNCSWSEAKACLEDSRAYGLAVHSHSDEFEAVQEC